uniref:Uncharacterized protein n=1 Tax=Rhizophora mucronata TaxID=61149 RepID=A0A2P2NST3_RHIMU
MKLWYSKATTIFNLIKTLEKKKKHMQQLHHRHFKRQRVRNMSWVMNSSV